MIDDVLRQHKSRTHFYIPHEFVRLLIGHLEKLRRNPRVVNINSLYTSQSGFRLNNAEEGRMYTGVPSASVL